jgi:hypothetical protein
VFGFASLFLAGIGWGGGRIFFLQNFNGKAAGKALESSKFSHKIQLINN